MGYHVFAYVLNYISEMSYEQILWLIYMKTEATVILHA